MSKEQQFEADLIRDEIKKNYYKLKQVNTVPALAIPFLENIIKQYNRLYDIMKPDASDRAGFFMLRTQYKTMCALARHKINRDILK